MLNNKCPFIDNLWRRAAKIKETPLPGDKAKPMPTLEVLRVTEWVPEFEKLMRNRMIMGAFRYGRIKDQDYSGYDLPYEIHRRCSLYEQDRNLEHLVDVANIALLAFLHGTRIGERMVAQDDTQHSEWTGE